MAEAGLRSQPAAGKIGKIGALAMTVLVAACQTMVPKGTPPPTPTPTPVDTGPGVGLPTDTERHRVAMLVPMTGPNAAVGQSLANAANLAVLDTGGQRIRVTMYDTALGAAAATQRAIAEGNKVILGPLLGEDVAAAAPIARKAGVPLISFSNDSSVAGNGVYLLGYSPAQSIERVVGYARSRGVNTFAGLMPNGVYGQRASTVFIRAVEQAGGRVVGMQSYDRAPRSIAAAVQRLGQTSSYDALLIADSGGVSLQVVPLARRGSGVSARILGTELWNTEPSLASSAAMRGAWFASVSDTLYGQLSNKYRARFGKAPYRLSSLGYDAVLLVTRVARDWKPGSNFPARALTESGGFSGIDGAFRFGRDGVAERMLEVQQIDAGRFTTVSAAPSRFAE